MHLHRQKDKYRFRLFCFYSTLPVFNITENQPELMPHDILVSLISFWFWMEGGEGPITTSCIKLRQIIRDAKNVFSDQGGGLTVLLCVTLIATWLQSENAGDNPRDHRLGFTTPSESVYWPLSNHKKSLFPCKVSDNIKRNIRNRSQ